MVHHEPDLSIVGCVGCGALVEASDLVADAPHVGLSCCTFHPYHFWCYRVAPPDPRPWTSCADCGDALPLEDVSAAATWLWQLRERLHPAFDALPGSSPRPAPLRFVRVRQRGSFERRGLELAPLSFLRGREPEYHAHHGKYLEVVHAAGCPREPEVVMRLRAAPGDLDARRAYAEDLARSGEAERAAFVRIVLAKRRGAKLARVDERSLGLDATLPASWRQAIARPKDLIA